MVKSAQSTGEKLFIVFNETDGVPVTHEPVSEEQADEIIKFFPDRFKHQGYYLTSGRVRIDPKEVVLVKLDYEDDGEYDYGGDDNQDPF